ncbi:unnamed protein product [Blepharisma stoltei]|uniref:Uncharacterized protein n=1 Tax=Blepharisma stoltei TaxID=1481888 RepID=A0AAU9IQN4_9CILI|nr:unnamed protein product [Blepharisma stoltei]
MEHLPILNKPKVFIGTSKVSPISSDITLPTVTPRNRIVKRQYSNLGRTFNFPKAYYQQYHRRERSMFDSPTREARMAKEIEKIKRMQQKISKERIIQNIFQQYGTQFSPKEIKNLTEDDLLKKALKKNLYLKEKQAAVTIQNKWKKYNWKKLQEQILLKREISAKMIQNAWNKYKGIKLEPKKLRKSQINAAIMIQKMWKGYKSRSSYMIIKEKNDLMKNLQFFEKIKEENRRISAIKIQRCWRNYKQRKINKKIKFNRQQSIAKKIKKKVTSSVQHNQNINFEAKHCLKAPPAIISGAQNSPEKIHKIAKSGGPSPEMKSGKDSTN